MRQNLRSIGEQFVGLASMPAKSFRAFLRERFVFSRISLIKDLEDRVKDEAFAERDWLNTIDFLISSLRTSMGNDTSVVPIDLVHRMSPEDALMRAQSYISMYGSMMIHWGEITEAASSLSGTLNAM